MYTPSTGPLVCPHCSATKIVGFGAKKGQIFIDLPHDGKPTFVSIDRKRYRCKGCGKTFLERLDGIDERRNLSLRLISYIQRLSVLKPFQSIANEVGVTEGTVRNIFNEYLAQLEGNLDLPAPDILSIDEITVIGKPRYLASDFRRGVIVGIMEGKDRTTITAALQRLSNPDRVKTVIMDINPECRGAVEELFPQAKIVVNPAYIINTVLRFLEAMRKATRKGLPAKDSRLLAHDRELIVKLHRALTDQDKEQLAKWEERFKKLAAGYWRKEELRAILDGGDREQAMESFLFWQNNVLADSLTEYLPVIDSIFEWREQVFGWIDLPFTNKNDHYKRISALESTIEKGMRGYSFDAVKARLLAGKAMQHGFGISIYKATERF